MTSGGRTGGNSVVKNTGHVIERDEARVTNGRETRNFQKMSGARSATEPVRCITVDKVGNFAIEFGEHVIVATRIGASQFQRQNRFKYSHVQCLLGISTKGVESYEGKVRSTQDHADRIVKALHAFQICERHRILSYTSR